MRLILLQFGVVILGLCIADGRLLAGEPSPQQAREPSPSTEYSIAFQAKDPEPSTVKGPSFPIVLSTIPKNGEMDVDPSLKTVTVIFDRDMGDGMSWTGEVPVDDSRKAVWKDKRTCELPVTLAAGQGYRIGINSPSHRNFKSREGKPAPATGIYFATQGATAEVKQKFAVPKVVSIEPANGAKDVDPGIAQLKVTFDIPMSGGMSWTGGGDSLPPLAEGKKGSWSEDRRTCILPVALQPGRTYELSLNSPEYSNFRSEWKVPSEPVPYTFTTRK